MSNSPLLSLPLLSAGQAQKHVTHNDALSLLDGLVHLSVIARGAVTPPSSPNDGDRYLLGTSPSGDWSGNGAAVALRVAGAWRFFTPHKGWRCWVEAETLLLVFDGTNWTLPSSAAPTSLQNLSLLGVDATADATNRLSVSSPAALFNHAGAGVQLKLNKNAATDTASLLYQTNWSGRAEIGTTGDDSFHFKVSPDGSNWKDAIVIDASSGLALAYANPTAALGLATKQYVDGLANAGGSPGGTSGQVQFKDGSTFGGFTISGDATLNTTTGALTLANSTVSNAKLATMGAGTLKGNNTGTSASPIDLTAAQTKSLLGITTSDVSGLGTLATQSGTFSGTHSGSSSGTNTGDQTITLTGDVTGSGTASFAATIAAATVSNAKLASMAALTFKANATTGSAAPQDLSIDQSLIALNVHALLQARALIMI